MALILHDKPETVNKKTKYEGYTALHIASGRGFDEMCKLLIDGGDADVNCRTIHQSTPLIRAIMNEKTSTALLLLSRGANFKLANDRGETPLLLAVKKKNKPVLEYLIKNGCDIYEQNSRGESALSVCDDDELKMWMITIYSGRKLL